MYYEVGETFDGYRFIFDSDDNSCELVKYEDLIDSGVDFKSLVKQTFDYNKFRMLHKLPMDDYLKIMVVSYTVTVSDDKSCFDVNIDLAFVIERVDNDITETYKKKNVNKDYYLESHIITLVPMIKGVVNSKSNKTMSILDFGLLETEIMHYISFHKSYKANAMFRQFGINTPVQMFDYIMKLSQCHDLDGISRAYGYAFTDNFCIGGKRTYTGRRFKFVEIKNIITWW